MKGVEKLIEELIEEYIKASDFETKKKVCRKTEAKLFYRQLFPEILKDKSTDSQKEDLVNLLFEGGDNKFKKRLFLYIYKKCDDSKDFDEGIKNNLWSQFVKFTFPFYLLHPIISTSAYLEWKEQLRKNNMQKLTPFAKLFITFLIYITLITGICVGGAFAGTTIYTTYAGMIDKNTIQLVSDATYEDGSPLLSRVYGSALELSDLKITYQKKAHDKTYQEFVTFDMVEEYDEEKIGYQTSYIKFNGTRQKLVINTSPLDLTVPAVTFTNKQLSWDKINNATSYKVYVGETASSLTFLQGTDKTFFDLSTFRSGDHYFAVEAYNPLDKYATSKMSTPNKVLILDTPTGLAYNISSTHKIVWNAVNKADYYSLTIDGLTHNNITDTYFEYDVGVGAHEISLTAYSSLFNSIEKSAAYSFKVLPKITSVSYDGAYLNWNAVENASSYDVYVDGSSSPISCLENKLDMSAYAAKVYSIDIVAKSIDSSIFDSDTAHFDILINFTASLSSGVLSWPSLGSSYSYYLYIDNALASSSIVANSIDLKTMSIDSGAHSVKVLAKHTSSSFLNEYSNSVSFTKLTTPILSIDGDYVVASGESIEATFYLDGAVFDGNISTIAAGDHAITAKYFAINDEQIDSDTGVLNIHKLSTPVVSVVNDSIIIDYPTRDTKYYLDGAEFDGNLANIASGAHALSAKYVGNGSTNIDSNMSTPLNITKLPAPSIKIEDHQIVCYENNINVRYYADNEEFGGSYISLSRGLHTVKAYNLGDGGTTISSVMSSDLVFYKTNAALSASTSGTNKVQVTLTSDDSVTSMQLTVEFYKDSAKFDEIDYPKTSETPFIQTVLYARGSGTADKLVITANIEITYNAHIYTDTIVYESTI